MRWKGGRRSENVEDRRGQRASAGVKLGGGVGVLVIIVIAVLFGANPQQLMQLLGPQQGGNAPVNVDPAVAAEQQELADFVSVVLADTEDTWHQLFGQMGRTYREPKLVLFTGQVKSACGFAQSATGPFYCGPDESVYIDLAFYQQLRDRLGAPGDFAQAYVIAHEVGHHVQKLLGTLDQVHAMREKLTETEYNKLQVCLELQADFYAGVWTHHAQKARQILEAGDIDEALNAASMIGDDHLQRQARGYVVPDSFTHGTSAQRSRWFRLGFETGDLSRGDTFSADRL